MIDCTTSEPASTEKDATELRSRGIRFVDAPLTRTSRDADTGRLNVLIGGSEDDVVAAKPVLKYFAENTFHIGTVGTAHKMKLINNFLTIGCAAVVIEAVSAARSLAVDTKALFEVVSVGGANSGAFQMIMPWVNDCETKFPFSVARAAKDIGYYLAATETGAMAGALSQTLRGAIEKNLQDVYLPALTDHSGKLGTKP